MTNPTLPKLIGIAQAIPGTSPTNLPRTDLVTAFLTGITGVNKPANVVPSEMMRLNTAIAAVPFASRTVLASSARSCAWVGRRTCRKLLTWRGTRMAVDPRMTLSTFRWSQ